MAFVSEEVLLNYGSRIQLSESKDFVKAASGGIKHTIFLSHSHKDITAVKGFIKILSRQGINIYIDSLDPSLPTITNRQTADKIKSKIKDIEFFWVLATTSALNSRWVPWEIGIADSIKAQDKVFIIPVSDTSGKFTGNEYLQLYHRLELNQTGTIFEAYAPGSNKSILLSYILNEAQIIRKVLD